MEKIIIGVLSGAGYGIVAYMQNLKRDPEMKFKPETFIVTLVLAALIGLVVDVKDQPGYMDDLIAAMVPVGIITFLNKTSDVAPQTIMERVKL